MLWRCAVLYEGISRPWRLATLTILILLAMVSLGILLLIISPFPVLIMTRLLYIFSYQPIFFHQPKRWTPANDYSYYNYYQHNRSRFYCSTRDIFSKKIYFTSSRFGTQQPIYDSHRYLHWIFSSNRFIQYIAHRSGSQWVSCIIYLHAKFGTYKCHIAAPDCLSGGPRKSCNVLTKTIWSIGVALCISKKYYLSEFYFRKRINVFLGSGPYIPGAVLREKLEEGEWSLELMSITLDTSDNKLLTRHVSYTNNTLVK